MANADRKNRDKKTGWQPTDEQLAVWRARFAVQVLGTLALTVLFGLILTGVMHAYFASTGGIDRGDDEFFTFILNHQAFITYFHRYGGYALMLLLPGSGLALGLLGQRCGGGMGNVLRWIGAAVFVTGLGAAGFSHITGHLGGTPDQEMAVDERGNPTGALADPDSENIVAVWGRQPARAEAFDLHTHEAVMALVPSVLLLMLGAGIASTGTVRKKCGLK